jgi:hypothetical protein
MKNINLMHKAVYLMLICLLITSCSSDDENSNDNSQEITEIETTAESGSWRITNLNDSGEDETSDFAGYDFTFNSDGSIIADNGANTVTGNWSVTEDNDSDDAIEFNILFPISNTNDFEDLNDDWDIESISSTRIALIDIGEGNEGDEILTFEKN